MNRFFFYLLNSTRKFYFRHLETFSVMGDPATAMRDPVFYRWHAYIDYIFQQHKETLPPYSEQVVCIFFFF